MAENTTTGLESARPAHSQLYPWYDSVWLTRYAKAKAVIRAVRPEALPAFQEALRIFRTPPKFQVKPLGRIFGDDTLAEIRRVVETLRPADLELHEARMFGRFVVHDQPFFTELQQRTIARVSDAVGEPVEASYNFLSLYSNLGRCPAHMDSPEAKWTLDLCLNQSVPWPIWFSPVQPWPESDGTPWAQPDWEQQVRLSLPFTPHTLQPGEAVMFSGSSQWHYRDPIPATSNGARQFCDLLFFHYIPQGTSELVRPKNWARLFGIPELADIV
jgi:hypothetical protein